MKFNLFQFLKRFVKILKMEEIDNTSLAINRRIQAIQEKIYQGESDNDFEVRSTDSHQSGSHNLEFFDDEWHPVIEQVDEGHFDESMRLIEEIYKKLVEDKAEKSLLIDKADRNYVDSKIKDVEEDVYIALKQKVEEIYLPVQDRIDQMRNNADAIHQYFTQTSLTIRKELTALRKKYEQKDEPEAPKIHPISSPPQHFQKPRSKTEPTCVVLSSPYKRQMPYHSPLKQKKKVPVPELPELMISHHDI